MRSPSLRRPSLYAAPSYLIRETNIPLSPGTCSLSVPPTILKPKPEVNNIHAYYRSNKWILEVQKLRENIIKKYKIREKWSKQIYISSYPLINLTTPEEWKLLHTPQVYSSEDNGQTIENQSLNSASFEFIHNDFIYTQIYFSLQQNDAELFEAFWWPIIFIFNRFGHKQICIKKYL